MPMAFTTFIVTLCIALPMFQLYVGAAVLKRDVFDPTITYPTAGTVWHVGEIHNVTWDTSILPPNFAGTGMLVLGFLNDTANDGNEHLDLDHPLATGFPLSSGREDITVPAVPPKDSYIIILFGDSGNASPQFTITNISINMPPSPPPSTPSPSASASASTAASSSDSSPASASAGLSSIEEASSPVQGPSSALTPISNSAAVVSTKAASQLSTTPLAVSHSSAASSPTSPSSNSGSPSPSVGNSTNVTANTNNGQIQSVSFGLLCLNVAVVIFASWTL